MERDPDITLADQVEVGEPAEHHATTGGAAVAGAVTGGVVGLVGGPVGAAIGAVGGALVGVAAERIMHSSEFEAPEIDDPEPIDEPPAVDVDTPARRPFDSPRVAEQVEATRDEEPPRTIP